MKLIVGLGNPGPEYAKTRHNVGFMVLEQLANQHGFSGAKSKFHGQLLDGQIAGNRCLFLCPTTYMNLSGTAVSEVVRFHKLDPETEVMVVVDDVALPIGKLRMRASGSSGGQNGLKDIEQKLGTQNYARLRFGIDPPGRIPRKDYVLGRFTPNQQNELGPAIDDACAMLESWLDVGIVKTMSLFNARK